ncbi:membrane metallo-endopeptidase-like 1 [Dermacentor andersoni]|uniref:membrane metallo-endopeptidase-like 1 n=1 Tax=Dermacentor andersoni TaxID=34620 RepID=UPI0024163701|nr:membrane metallo-endopeptidase-like 1 [Dermacentor andersoni]
MLNKQFSLVNITLTENQTIEFLAEEYYSNLDKFLKSVHCDTLFNFAGLRRVLSWAAQASQKFRNVSFELKNASSGIKAQKPRWETCVSAINNKMPEIAGYLYVQHKFSGRAKEEVEDLVRRLTAIFNETIQNSTWMDNQTKSVAEEKLANMITKIGYPSRILNKTYLEQLYPYVPNLNLSSPYLEMSYYISQNNWKRELLMLGKPYDKNSVWLVGPTAVNAFYNLAGNEMLFPSAILQGVFYQHGLPRSLNFGAIGMVVGHEMTHGFDNTGEYIRKSILV